MMLWCTIIDRESIYWTVSFFIYRYFPQEEVLKNVPDVFLLLGGCYAVLQLLGCLLLKNPSDYKVNVSFFFIFSVHKVRGWGGD